MLASESSLELPPSESESFKVSLILSVLINIVCEVFSALELSLGFSMLLVVHKTSADWSDLIYTLDLHAGNRGYSDSMRLISGVSCDKTKASIESNVRTACCATIPSRESSIHTYMACGKVNRVTETTNMEESDGTNLKPKPPILFFNKLMKVRKYKYSFWTAGMRCHGVLVHHTEGSVKNSCPICKKFGKTWSKKIEVNRYIQ